MDQLQVVEELFDTEVKLFKLIGESGGNADYSKAKAPAIAGWNKPSYVSPSKEVLESHIKKGGWIGLRIPDSYILVDVDNVAEGQAVYEALLNEKVKHHAIKTPNGYQFIFKSDGSNHKQWVKSLTLCGALVDYRIEGKGYTVLPTTNTEGRQWIRQDSQIDIMPYQYKPLTKSKDIDRHFDIPMQEGGRDDGLTRHVGRLITFNVAKDTVRELAHYINTHFFDPMEDSQVEKILKSIEGYRKPVQSYETVTEEGKKRINSKKVANMFRDKFKIIHNENLYYYYSPKQGIWKSDVSKFMQHHISKVLDDAYSAKKVADIYAAIKMDSYQTEGRLGRMSYTDMNCAPRKVVFENGTYDIDTGVFKEGFNHEEYHTVSIEAKYDEMLEGLDDVPNDTIDFLRGVMGDEEIKFLFEWIGYCMVKKYDMQKTVLLYGNGNNGKSTVINLITRILGDHNVSSASLMDLLNDKFAAAELHNKMLNAFADIGDNFLNESSLLKALTGDDSILVQKKNQHPFKIMNFAKLLFSCNALPTFRDNSDGLLRRIIILPMTKVPTVKKSLDSFFTEGERERCIMYALKHIHEVYKRGEFSISETMQQHFDQWKEDGDNVGLFLKEECTIVEGKDRDKALYPVKKLYEDYKTYCYDNGIKPLASKNLGKRLEDKGFGKKRAKQGMVYIGIQDPDAF